MTSIIFKLKRAALFSCLMGFSGAAFTQGMDLRAGVTDMSQRIQGLHHFSLTIVVVMGILVFGAMFYTIYAHRKSKHPNPADFDDNTRLEVLWTVIPVLILVSLAIPATLTLIEIEDNTDAELSVLITGSQWKWHYRYLEADIDYYSNMATPQEQINNFETKGRNYLLEVDNPLVLPTGRKVRFLTTADDVIHSWWVPDFAVKQDAIPGFINEAWARVEQPGMYRGQCAELCGKDHAYMPIQVEVLPAEEFDQWLEEQQLARELAGAQAVADRARTWTMAELMDIGQGVFVEHCATCHEADGSGQGTTYPALAGGEVPTGPLGAHIDRVLNGVADTEMQAWAPQLTDLELAGVITYERNAFGNNLGDVVQPLTVFESR